jgi:hypothetical protein
LEVKVIRGKSAIGHVTVVIIKEETNAIRTIVHLDAASIQENLSVVLFSKHF